jgi:hypothetical protein
MTTSEELHEELWSMLAPYSTEVQGQVLDDGTFILSMVEWEYQAVDRGASLSDPNGLNIGTARCTAMSPSGQVRTFLRSSMGCRLGQLTDSDRDRAELGCSCSSLNFPLLRA